jgi:hypothetical protein
MQQTTNATVQGALDHMTTGIPDDMIIKHLSIIILIKCIEGM